jgi:adenylate cyclase
LLASVRTYFEGLSGRRRLGLQAFLASAVITLLITHSAPFQGAERSTYDIRMRIWQSGLDDLGLDRRIGLVSLDEGSTAEGWTDEKTLDTLWTLHRSGVASVVVFGHEMFRNGIPSPDRLPPTTRVVDAPALLLSSAGNDQVTVPSDGDGVVRSLPVDHPAFHLVTDLCRAVGEQVWGPRGNRFYVAMETTQDSSKVSDDYIAYLPIQQLDKALENPESQSLFKGAAILMGRTTVQGETRYVSTSRGSIQPSLFYACAVSTMLRGWNLYNLEGWPGTLLTLVLMAGFTFTLSGRRPNLIFLAGVVGLAALAILSSFLFPLGICLPTAQLMVGLFLGMMALIFLEFQRARHTLANFGGAEDSHLSGTETQATIVFTELPKYLMELERLQHKELLSRRRDYNLILEQVARKYHGQVLDYQGDAQMIGFGLRHDDDDDHPLEATAAALELVRIIPSLARTWGISADDLNVHAGVCTGVVALGHVGALQKQDVAAIGDTTNTAARLMGAAMKLELPVVIAETTYLASGGRLAGLPLPPVELKGKSAPVAVYSVESVDEGWRQGNLGQKKERIPSGGTLLYQGQSKSDLWVTVTLSLFAFALLRLVGLFDVAFPLEGRLYDFLQSHYGLAASDPRIIIVGIDYESCAPERLGPFPWPRGVHAQVLRNLAATGYAGIFFDVAFKQPRLDDPEGDEALRQAIFDDPRVAVAAALYEDKGRYHDPLFFLPDSQREELRQRNQLGLINKREDTDGQLRWAVLAARETVSDDHQRRRLYPTGALALLLSPESKLETTSLGLQAGANLLPSTTTQAFPNELLIRFGPPTTKVNSQPAPGSYRYLSFWRLLDPTDPIFRELDGTYLFVGDNFQGGERDDSDRVDTTVGRLKGVEAHARTLDTILNKTYIGRASPRAMAAWELLLAALTTYVLVTYRTWRDYTPRVLGIVGLQAAAYVISLTVFSVWMDFVHPLTTVAAICGAVLVGRYLLTLRALSRFVPAEVADEILFHHRARDRRMVATVLLTDIRGYTTLSEGRSAVAMLDILNEYHRRTVDCYERHGGQALTYQGDAQIVVFGVFGRRRKPAMDAVAAALELQSICAQLRQEWGIENQDDFDVGAGLCTGEVEVGFLGGKDNLQYSVVGETVRKSHKVQSLSTELAAPVILDEETFYAGFGYIDCDDLGPVQLKGIEGESRLYRAKGVDPKGRLVYTP